MNLVPVQSLISLDVLKKIVDGASKGSEKERTLANLFYKNLKSKGPIKEIAEMRFSEEPAFLDRFYEE